MADYEKKDYDVNAASAEHGVQDIVKERGAATGEAADLYGGMFSCQRVRFDQFEARCA
jgi:amino acid transporter